MYLFIKTCKIFVKIPGGAGVCGFPSARLLYLPVIKLKRLDPGRRIFRKLKNA